MQLLIWNRKRFLVTLQLLKKYEINRMTLQRRYKGITRSQQEAHSEDKALLTASQEALLIQHINTLTDHGLPPTHQILRNLTF